MSASTAEVWQPQVEALAGRRRLIRLDLPGHGLSPVRPASSDIADIIATRDALASSRVSFVGLSIGGMVGRWLAAKHPGRLGRLAILCSAAQVPAPELFLARAAAVRAANSTGHLPEALLPRWFTAPVRDRNPDLCGAWPVWFRASRPPATRPAPRLWRAAACGRRPRRSAVPS